MHSVITIFDTAVTKTAGEILDKHRQKKEEKKKKRLGHCRNS